MSCVMAAKVGRLWGKEMRATLQVQKHRDRQTDNGAGHPICDHCSKDQLLSPKSEISHGFGAMVRFELCSLGFRAPSYQV